MRLVVVIVMIVVVGSVLFILGLDTSGTARAQDKPIDAREALKERYQDPPGEPAVLAPGARVAPPVMYGPFLHYQVNVSSGGANIVGDAANEPSITIDPTSTNRMAIGWRQFDTISSNFREAGVGYTTNSGMTWTAYVLDDGVFRSDPVLDADASGNFYYNSLFSPSATSDTILCHVFKSSNGGQSWGAGVDAYGDDKEWLAVDRTGGAGDGHVYSAWRPTSNGPNTFTRSINGAASFESPVLVDAAPPEFGNLAVGADGAVYSAGVAYPDFSAFYVSRSTNAQSAGQTPTFTTTPVDMGGALVANDFFSPNPRGLMGMAWLATSPSLPTAGHIYMIASVETVTDNLDVHFVRSLDGGATWSAPVRVNDDPVGTDAWQWFATISVAPDGRIDAIWNDTRDSIDDHNISMLMYSFSTDEGVTWSPNRRVSPQWDSRLGWPGVGMSQQKKIGDYYDMVSDNGSCSVAWAATFNGEQDVFFTRLERSNFLGPCPRGQSVSLAVPSSYPLVKGAVNVACAGDTVLIASGTYPESPVVLTSSAVLKADGGSVVIE
jgi:hypothetical protein